MAPRRDPSPFLPLTPAAFHVLLALADGPKHGYLILKEVEERTEGAVRLSTGTLYGLIKRFLDDELIVELAAEIDGQDRRRPYRLTPFGRDVAAAEAARLQTLVTAARAVRLLPH
jgi:DNA-binding PadR family transcriptional regulator